MTSEAFKLGKFDANRGHTCNPYSELKQRADWERGHAKEYAAGRGPFPSFATLQRARRKACPPREEQADLLL